MQKFAFAAEYFYFYFTAFFGKVWFSFAVNDVVC